MKLLKVIKQIMIEKLISHSIRPSMKKRDQFDSLNT